MKPCFSIIASKSSYIIPFDCFSRTISPKISYNSRYTISPYTLCLELSKPVLEVNFDMDRSPLRHLWYLCSGVGLNAWLKRFGVLFLLWTAEGVLVITGLLIVFTNLGSFGINVISSSNIVDGKVRPPLLSMIGWIAF